MFSKLLKYDLRAVLKYWWIAAVSSVLLAFSGGCCLNSLVKADSELTGIHIFSILGMIISFVGLFIFVALSEVLILVRFYKNFFSDEGYLTFTLPVKKSSLLNSKIAAAGIMTFAAGIVFSVDVFAVLIIGAGEEIFTPEFLKALSELIKLFFSEQVVFNIAIAFEFIMLFIVLTLLQMLSIFICITAASVIAKKHKVLAAVGIYYVASGALSFIMQMLFIPNIFFISPEGDIPLTRVIDLVSELPEPLMQITFVIGLFGILAVTVLVFLLLWWLEYYLLDKKLNLE